MGVSITILESLMYGLKLQILLLKHVFHTVIPFVRSAGITLDNIVFSGFS